MGRTPWSAADALVGLLRAGATDFAGEKRVQGDPRGRGRPPHHFAALADLGRAPAPSSTSTASQSSMNLSCIDRPVLSFMETDAALRVLARAQPGEAREFGPTSRHSLHHVGGEGGVRTAALRVRAFACRGTDPASPWSTSPVASSRLLPAAQAAVPGIRPTPTAASVDCAGCAACSRCR